MKTEINGEMQEIVLLGTILCQAGAFEVYGMESQRDEFIKTSSRTVIGGTGGGGTIFGHGYRIVPLLRVPGLMNLD